MTPRPEVVWSLVTYCPEAARAVGHSNHVNQVTAVCRVTTRRAFARALQNSGVRPAWRSIAAIDNEVKKYGSEVGEQSAAYVAAVEHGQVYVAKVSVRTADEFIPWPPS